MGSIYFSLKTKVDHTIDIFKFIHFEKKTEILKVCTETLTSKKISCIYFIISKSGI